MIIFILLFLFISNTQNKAESNRIDNQELSLLLDSLNLQGSILIYDPQLDNFFSNDFSWADTKFTPASTFKIPNSIIGLEVGVLNDSTIFKWDGKPRYWR